MTSSAQRGSYYKARTKRWLESKGYQVADLEKMHGIFRNGRPALWRKQDQFGSDLLAVSVKSIIFVQVKGGEQNARGNFPEARRRFQQFQFPPWTRQWVIAWPARSRVPRIVEMRTHGEATTERFQGAGAPSGEASGGVNETAHGEEATAHGFLAGT